MQNNISKSGQSNTYFIEGIVKEVSADNYEIFSQGKKYFAYAIGVLKLKKDPIIVGDKVLLKIKESPNIEKEITIIKIFPRTNTFLKPRVANVDNVFIVTSLIEPKFNEFYLNKLITFFQFYQVKPFLILSKSDLIKGIELEKKIRCRYQKMGYSVFIFKNDFSNYYLSKIKQLSKNNLNLLVGQTGVGKTTILNFLNSKLNLQTQEISKALGRGKHTTSNPKIFTVFDSALFIDTPGFSSLKLPMSPQEISKSFLNFSVLSLKCKFKNCLHKNEIDCFVKNKTDKEVYNFYLKLLDEGFN